MHADHVGILVAQPELQQAVLHGLETRGAPQLVAEGRVVRRRHRGQHFPHAKQLRLHLADALQGLEGRIQVVAHHALAHEGQLVQEQLDPQLRHVVHDDEHRLVVRIGDGLLRRQQLRELQVVAIGLRSCPDPSARPRRSGRCASRRRRLRCSRQAPDPGRHIAPAIRQRPIQRTPARLARRHAGPEARRMIHVPRVGQLMAQQVAHHPLATGTAAPGSAKSGPAPNSCPSGCADCPRAAGCTGSHGARPRPASRGASTVSARRFSHVQQAMPEGFGFARAAQHQHRTRPARCAAGPRHRRETGARFHPAAADADAAAEIPVPARRQCRRARCSRTQSARLS